MTRNLFVKKKENGQSEEKEKAIYIIKELEVEDRLGFREMFRMDVMDFDLPRPQDKYYFPTFQVYHPTWFNNVGFWFQVLILDPDF